MEEEEGLDHRLEEVPEIVGAADVRELVEEHDLKLFGAQAGERCNGQQNPGTKNASGEGTGNAFGEAKIDEPADAHLAAEDVEAEEQGVGRALVRAPAQASNEAPSTEGTKREKEDAGEPEGIEIRHEALQRHAVDGRGLERAGGFRQGGGNRLRGQNEMLRCDRGSWSGLIVAGFLIREGGDGNGQHAEQRAESEHVAGVGAVAGQGSISNSVDECDGCALPEEMDEGPSESFPVVCHWRCPFCSMRLRSSSSSRSLTGSMARACMASCAAEPANRRSLMSRTS